MGVNLFFDFNFQTLGAQELNPGNLVSFVCVSDVSVVDLPFHVCAQYTSFL